jgi:hypothetical protein
MNQRIRELVDQILPNEKEWHKGDPKDWGYFFSNDELEKFAELIVGDACRVLLKWKGEPFPFDEDLAVSLIKEHFEIKQ